MKYKNILVLAIKKCSHTVWSGHQSRVTKIFVLENWHANFITCTKRYSSGLLTEVLRFL